MGLEYITQPQVFLQPISALGGIAGFVTQPEYQFPPVTSFYTWTTSTASTATSITLDGAITLLSQPGSYIVSIGGVIQSPLTYTVDPFARTITFDSPVLSGINITVTQIGTVGLTASSFAGLTATNLQNTNLTATNIQNTNLTTTNVTILDNGTITGSTSSTFINIGSLSARSFDLVHTPANDGVDPIFNIGETDTLGFSGLRVRYEEPTSKIVISSRTGSTILTSAIIDVVTGQVGISSEPITNQTLTVAGNTYISDTLNLKEVQFKTAQGVAPGANLFIGDDTTGNSTVAGNHNFTFGVSAGYSLQGAAFNTFIGRLAGASTINGNNNTFIGTNAGQNNTSGQDNIFLGSDAGTNNATGSWNVFLGGDAGESNTVGEQNIFIGLSAGANNISGSYNICLGSNTGVWDVGNATGSDNIIIGRNASTVTDSLSNTIVLGFSAQAFTNNELAIGSASAPLSVVKDTTLTGQVSSVVVRLNGQLFRMPIIPV